MMKHHHQIIQDVLYAYLNDLDLTAPISLEAIGTEVLTRINQELEGENAIRDKQFKIPR